MRLIGLAVILALSLALAPLVADGQQAGKAYQIGVIVYGGSYRAAVGGLREGLCSSGLEEGRQWVLEVREPTGDLNAVEEVARELARRRVDLLYTVAGSVTQRAMRATSDLPIVFAVGSDPVMLGLVQSLNRPGGRLTSRGRHGNRAVGQGGNDDDTDRVYAGRRPGGQWTRGEPRPAGGNLTGLSNIISELGGKQLELLKEAVPQVARVAVLYNPVNPATAPWLARARAAARALTVELQAFEVRKPERLGERIFGAGGLAPVKVLVYTDQPELFLEIAQRYRDLILASDDRESLANRLHDFNPRVASSFQRYLETVDSYGVEVLAQWRSSAVFLGPGTAHRVRKSYPPPDVVALALPEIVLVRGCFQGFLRSRGFEFLDLDSGKRYEGTIARQLRATIPADFELVLGRASATRYVAEIEVRRRGDTEKYRLMSYRSVSQIDGR